MPDITAISGVPEENIVKKAGVARADVVSLSSSGTNISFPVAGGGGGGGDSVSTKAVVYDGVDATSLVIQNHTLESILSSSPNNAATLSIWINLDGGTSGDQKYIYGYVTNEFPLESTNLTVRRSSTGSISDLTIGTLNYQDVLKGDDTRAWALEFSATSVPMDEWIHVCLVLKQASSGTGYDPTVFINGSSTTSDSTVGTFAPATNTIVGGKVALSSRYVVNSDSIDLYYEMDLSDYIVWSDELTSSEITEIYNAGVGGFDPSTNSGNYASSADLEIHYELGNTAEDTTEAPVTNNTGTTGNLVHTNVEFEAL